MSQLSPPPPSSSFNLNFDINYKTQCPICSDPLLLQDFQNPKTSNNWLYNNYVELCKKKFGLNAWPLCYHCYSSRISGAEQCYSCGIALMGPIFSKSTGNLESSHDHVCKDCALFTKFEIEQNQERRSKLANDCQELNYPNGFPMDSSLSSSDNDDDDDEPYNEKKESDVILYF